MIYIVLGPARTGSILLTTIISNFYKNDCEVIFYETTRLPVIDLSKNYIIHTHSKDILDQIAIDPKYITLVISKRKDIFSSVMSAIIASRTKEYYSYTDNTVEPFSITCSEFFKIFIDRYLKWYNDINFSLNYHKIATIYYEDFINNYSNVGTILNLPYIESYNISSTKSPYNYKDVILNWPELLYLFKCSLEYKKYGFNSLESYIDAIKLEFS